MNTLSMRELTAELNSRGVAAILTMSGGNCATIYLGKPNAEGQYEFAVGCGNYLDDELYAGDTCWGLDDSGESKPNYYSGSAEDFTPAKVAELIVSDYNRAQARFTCLECYSQFPASEGIVTNNQNHQEFTCNPCSTKSSCGACGEWSMQLTHNCSEGGF